MLRKMNSMEEERIKDKETIEHLRSKLTSQQDPQPPSSKKETDDIKRRLEKLESENKQLKEVQAENDKMKKEIEDLKKKQKNLQEANDKLKAKEKAKIKNKNETEENNNSYKSQKNKRKEKEEKESSLLKKIDEQSKEIKELKEKKPVEGSLVKQISLQTQEIDKLRKANQELTNKLEVQGKKEKEILSKWNESIPFLEDETEKSHNPPGTLKPPVLNIGNQVPGKLTTLTGTKEKQQK